MSFWNIVSETVGGIFKGIDSLTTTDEEKLKLKNEATKIQNELVMKLEEYEKTVVEKKAEVMVAELQQGDNYTKRARPTIIYVGLLAVVLNNILFPWVTWVALTFAENAIKLPSIELPAEFWYAWGGVAGIYAFRRTSEKVGEKKNGKI